MIRIVGKGYKYILVQLIDYFGTVNEITISLKSETGKKEYTKLFGKPLKLQKEKIKVRIISIKQSTLSDFFRIPIKSSLTMKTTTSDHGYEIYSACGIKHKLLFPEKIKIKKSKNHAISIFQTKISDFLEDGFAFLNKKVRIPYKIKPVLPNSSDYMEGALPATQIIAIQNYKSFKGYIGNMFALNPSIDEFFRRIQDIEGYNPQTDTLNFNNIIKLEIARCKLGYTNFDSFITEFNQNPKIRIELGIQSQKQLTPRSYQRNLTAIGSSLKEYGEILIQECRDLKLIGGKIAIWDRRFFECNSNGMKFKETGMFSDPDAGHYVKKTGKYSVLSGTGYTDSCIVDDWWMLPIYWDAVSANKNDNTGEILKTDSGNHFRGEYIPRMYHRLLGKLYDLRTTVERKNSNEVVGHHRSKMSNRGIEQARIFVSISNITALLTALTAFKVGRLDLIRSPSVFRRLSI
jgi:hypothetical protein